MKELVFATNNLHKIIEVQQLLQNRYRLLSLSDIGCNHEIEETATTIEGNAILKASFIRNNYGFDCFADDTGLEVDALNGKPGVFSARYSGFSHNHVANNTKLLKEMLGKSERKARFRTIIALFTDNNNYLFEGLLNGVISYSPIGTNGFGYDPIFIPDGYTKTLAEISLYEKNQISHRARAVNKLIEFLNKSDYSNVNSPQ